MKILVTHSSSFDFREKLYKPLRTSALNGRYEFILPQENGKEQLTREIIKDCKAVIAECSLPSTGQGIELGWANAYQVPIICIYEKGSKISGALSYVTDKSFEYSNHEEMIKFLGIALNRYY